MPPVCIDAGNDSSIAPVYLKNLHMSVRISLARPSTAVHFPSDTITLSASRSGHWADVTGDFGRYMFVLELLQPNIAYTGGFSIAGQSHENMSR